MLDMCSYLEFLIFWNVLFVSKLTESFIDNIFNDDLIVWLKTYQLLPVIILRVFDWNASNFVQLAFEIFAVHDGETYKIIGFMYVLYM